MTKIGVSGFLLLLAYPMCPGQSPESHKMVVVVVVDYWLCAGNLSVSN